MFLSRYPKVCHYVKSKGTFNLGLSYHCNAFYHNSRSYSIISNPLVSPNSGFISSPHLLLPHLAPQEISQFFPSITSEWPAHTRQSLLLKGKYESLLPGNLIHSRLAHLFRQTLSRKIIESSSHIVECWVLLKNCALFSKY